MNKGLETFPDTPEPVVGSRPFQGGCSREARNLWISGPSQLAVPCPLTVPSIPVTTPDAPGWAVSRTGRQWGAAWPRTGQERCRLGGVAVSVQDVDLRTTRGPPQGHQLPFHEIKGNFKASRFDLKASPGSRTEPLTSGPSYRTGSWGSGRSAHVLRTHRAA